MKDDFGFLCQELLCSLAVSGLLETTLINVDEASVNFNKRQNSKHLAFSFYWFPSLLLLSLNYEFNSDQSKEFGGVKVHIGASE